MHHLARSSGHRRLDHVSASDTKTQNFKFAVPAKK